MLYAGSPVSFSPENMKRNLDLTKGLYFSQSILLELTRRGLERKTA